MLITSLSSLKFPSNNSGEIVHSLFDCCKEWGGPFYLSLLRELRIKHVQMSVGYAVQLSLHDCVFLL